MGGFFDFLSERRDDMISMGIAHIWLVAVAVVISAVIGVILGIIAYQRPKIGTGILSVTSAFLTIPSFALFVLLLPVVGLGAPPVIIALILYGLLPVVRNTITGLREVDPAIIESAQGMGMNRRERLLKIELPMAWPVIMTGIRVTTVMLVGIATIGAIVLGPGYGSLIFDGLGHAGVPVAVNLVLAGILGTIVVAIIFDALFTLIGRLTTSRGLR